MRVHAAMMGWGAMFDINFYRKIHDIKKQIIHGDSTDYEQTLTAFNEVRSNMPYVYSIETTNACNMRCTMCPRTTLMTRPVETMKPEVYKRVVLQLEPHTDEDWHEWERFVGNEYGIHVDDVSENHFFLHVIARAIVLHGFGEPLLDKKIAERVGLLSARNVPTYFSCNPHNIKQEMMKDIFANGLGYIKFSIESVDDAVHENVRGQAGRFDENYARIMQLIEMKEKHNFRTNIVITMINFNRENQDEDFGQLRKMFEGTGAYVYLKSLDQKWYGSENYENASVHWREFCQAPWTFMSIKSNGDVVQCMEDYNNELVFGNVAHESLVDIWNSEAYEKFRRKHFTLQGLTDRCTTRCDMTLVGECCKGVAHGE